MQNTMVVGQGGGVMAAWGKNKINGEKIKRENKKGDYCITMFRRP